ncbi:MAG TPA: hypothetical protein VF044_01550, partial [Actinomycetota bacterium]
MRISTSGYSVQRPEGGVRLESLEPASSAWTRFAAGTRRETPYGFETITVGPDRTEQFLTVEERQGTKTWRWALDTGTLDPKSRADGSIAFLDGPAATPLRIAPAAILDASGEDVTPEGLRWQLDRIDGDWQLSLELDDAELPLPYVIDPATDYPSPLYLSDTASTETGSWRLETASPPTPANITTDTLPGKNNTGYWAWRPGVSNSTSDTPSATPTGLGWIADLAGGTGFPAGSWDFTVTVDIPDTTYIAGSAHLVVGVWKGTLSGGAFTATQTLLDPSSPGAEGVNELRPSANVAPLTVTESYALPKFALAANEYLYVEYWRYQIGGINTPTS